MAPSSASWPSVAETVDWLISASSTGSAPIRRNSARSWASVMLKLPEICAPVSPEIPVGFSLKLMIGRETISPSRTTANESETLAACSGGHRSGPGRRPLSRPRWAIRSVTSANAS